MGTSISSLVPLVPALGWGFALCRLPQQGGDTLSKQLSCGSYRGNTFLYGDERFYSVDRPVQVGEWQCSHRLII